MSFIKFGLFTININKIKYMYIDYKGEYCVSFGNTDVVRVAEPNDEFIEFYNQLNNNNIMRRIDELEEAIKCLPIYGEDYKKILEDFNNLK